MNTNDAVATRVLNLLKDKKMTQYRLEQESGITHGAMDRILNSQNKTVTLATVYKLARGFNISVMEFLDCDLFTADLEID
ncbi:MAG: helix-turn-helix transcriptional regulator [Clostridia bacterium]|nr:helix-turn-helix transcriptional regulator [Clostridia bacterium]